MSKMSENQFRFTKAGREVGATVLSAVMSDFSYSNHAHEEIALGVTLSGIQEFGCKGRMFRSNPGDIILFNPGDVHNGNPGTDAILRYTMLYLDADEFYALVSSVGSVACTPLRIPDSHFIDHELQYQIRRMAALVSMLPGTELECEGILYRMAQRMTQIMNVFQPERWRHQKDSLLLPVQDYIHDNIAEEISVNDLSQLANMSKYHFIRLFRNQFGLSPHQYILNQRVNKARQTLGTGLPPTEIAHRFGFFDVSHLNRLFKRAYGLTPKQYQNQLIR